MASRCFRDVFGGIPQNWLKWIFNRRSQNLASYYLFDLVACTPAAGWEKGQVENQVGVVRKRFFAKRRTFADLEELNE